MSKDSKDKILEQQKELGEEALILREKIVDGRVRSPQITDITKRLKKIEAEFDANNKKLMAFGIDDGQYFKKNYFKNINEVIGEALSILQQKESGEEQIEMASATHKITKEIPKDEKPSNSNHIVLRKRLRRKIDMLQELLDEAQEEINENRRAELAITKVELVENFREIKKEFDHLSNVNDDYETEEKEFENITRHYRATLKQMVVVLDTSEEKSIVNSIKLEDIKIPIFFGNVTEWPSFHDLFKNLVHNQRNFSNAEKMYRLKNYVRGEAGRLIQHLKVTDANYEAAWNILSSRYENVRLLFTTQVDKILDHPMVNTESAFSVRQLLDTTNECVQALKGLNIKIDDAEPFIARIIVRKLDKDGLRHYEQSVKKTKEIQMLEDVCLFLEQQYQALEAYKGKKQNSNFKTIQKQSNLFHISQKNCDFCKISGHEIVNCRKFQAATITERRNFLRMNKLCYRCINHKLDQKCSNSAENCKKCGKYHHTLLHVEEFKKETKNTEKKLSMMTEQEKKPEVLLATAQVRVKALDGNFITLRALIDQGSQKSTISEEAAQLLQLPRFKEKNQLHGLGGTLVGISKSKVCLEVRPRFLSNEKLMVEALVLNKLTTAIPDRSFKYNNDNWKNHMLADPNFNKSDRIDMVLGGDVYSIILEEGIHKNDKILAQSTKLGWILSGVLKSSQHKSKLTAAITTNLEKFWETEDMIEAKDLNEADKCIQHYRKNTTREENGKFVAKLPFQEENQLGNSRKQAMARFLSLENKLDRNPELRKEYVQFMQEYIKLGHMKKKITKKEGKYYLPHQAVIRLNSLTTKVRVVFDGSAKTTNGRSLNDILLVGPRLQRDLFDIILKWRFWKYVIIADIEKMYRQIKIAEEDQEYQIILWRESKSNPIQEFQLTTVTYGTACAPFLATMALQDIAERCENAKLSEIIKTDFYMDDLLTGANTIEECKSNKLEVTRELNKYGFHLRKWLSNCKDIIDDKTHFKENEVIQLEEENTIKTLGLHWNPSKDEFLFKISQDKTKVITKRQVLSKLASIFDPMGWLAPITVRFKLFVQKLWLLSINWDELLDKELSKEWIELEENLSKVEKIKLPRWNKINSSEKWELHGFADASGKAFASVIYAKKGPHITILAAKSRVNPVKNRKTLPKLELCAAHLLAKLMNKVIMATNSSVNVFAWSDSTITMGWIQDNKNKDKFIRNKVIEIHKLLPKAVWKHVRSNENPADLASRGMSPEKLLQSKLWWHGPVWLSESSFPNMRQSSPEKTIISLVTTQKDHFLKSLINKISNYVKLVRIVAYVQRFAIKQKRFERKPYLTVKELEIAHQNIIRYQQYEDFGEEINALRNNKQIDRKSKLATLNTFLDNDGILRVGGRLERSSLTYNQKHPIVLHKSKLVELLVEHIHKITLHGSNRLMECTLRRNYWVIGARNIIKKCIRYCPRCTRFNQRTSSQIMGNLPPCRVTETHPFSFTGVDYAGPYQIRCSKGRGQKSFKGYVAIFVCMATKAIHLEAVTDMTTECFLAALKRFFGRRGKCKAIYSDNGTNFVGASKKLEKDFKQVIKNNSEVAPVLAADKIEWKFIPPAAPHFGGIWEAGVKSMKYHLNRVVGDVKLTYEEMATLLIQIEAVLNSRPLCALSSSPEEENILTPGHFLIGHPIIDIAEPVSESTASSLNKWKLIQKMKQHFWKRWKEEYLTTLQQRYKWQHAQENLEKDQIVLIKNEVTHPCKWPLGKVLEVHKGEDGKARVVTLKVQHGSIKRPIQKLCPLMTSNVYDSVENRKYKTNMSRSSAPNITDNKNVSQKKYLFLFILLMIMGQVRMATQRLYGTIGATVSAIDNQTAIYFDNIGKLDMVNSKWNFVVYYDLSPYFEEVSGIQTSLRELQKTCPKLHYYEDICKQITDALNKRYDTLKRNNDLLIIPKRTKRAPFEFIGSLHHILFGMMDADDRKQMEENMRNLLDNQEDLELLAKQQTSIINSTVNIIKKTKDEVYSNFQRMSKQLQQFHADVSKTIITERLTSAFQILVTQLYMLIDDCENTQISIINLLIDINHGHINPQLLQPAQLQQELDKIQRQLPEKLALPGGSTGIPLKEVYSILMAKGIILDRQLIIKTEIPLFNSESSDIYKIIPIPLSKGNATIIPIIEADYIIYNAEKRVYSMMSQPDLNSCKQDLNNYLCNKNWAWIPATNKACEISALKGLQKGYCKFKQTETKNIWHKLHKENRWLYKVSENTDMEINCGKGYVYWLTLPPQGILTLKSGCAASSSQIFLEASKQFDSNVEILAKSIMWNKNLSELTSWHTKPLEVHISNSSQLDDLYVQLDKLQSTQIELRRLSFHTISGHSSLVIILVMLIIIFIIFIKFKCCKKKRRIQIDFTVPAAPSGRQNVQI